MDISVFALAFIATIYTVIVLAICHPIAYLYGKYWGRTTEAYPIVKTKKSDN
jgi:hypothetical protein